MLNTHCVCDVCVCVDVYVCMYVCSWQVVCVIGGGGLKCGGVVCVVFVLDCVC